MITKEAILKILSSVTDPEIPVLTIIDLGIVRDVAIEGNSGIEEVRVIISPTYSGCPAMDVLSMGIRLALSGNGFKKVAIEQRLFPAWTTDWMTDDAKRKLKEYGIAPPEGRSGDAVKLFHEDLINCPRCESGDTALISKFGATSCKALYQCNSCKEPFEYFKCH